MKKLAIVMFVMLAAVAPAAAAPINVVAGKPVTITGDVGVITCCWADSSVFPPAALSTIVDEVFRPAGTLWQDGTVWWDERHAGSLNNVIEIDLLGLYLVDSVTLQADDNDRYALGVRNEAGIWYSLGFFDTAAGVGMQTRGPFALAPFLATAFRIDAFDGDQWYSVSEFQASGTQVPEPMSLLLFGTGAAALAVKARRRKTQQ
jgi:hypothetical protein